MPTFFIWSTTYHNCSRFGFCVIFPTVFSPNNIVWAMYKTLLVYLASIKASASYQQIFVEFNQKCATTAELVFKHGQLPLNICPLCIFVWFYNFWCQNWNWKNTGAMFLYILGCKNTNATFLVGFEFEITSLIHRVGLGRLWNLF